MHPMFTNAPDRHFSIYRVRGLKDTCIAPTKLSKPMPWVHVWRDGHRRSCLVERHRLTRIAIIIIQFK